MDQQTPAYAPGRYAAIDIGTVTARLLVADVDGCGALAELDKGHAICNLGVGVDKTGHLDAEAIDRVCTAAQGFVAQIDALRPEGGDVTLVASATSASRDADNADEFASRLAKLGVPLRVIPGEREAALSFGGASSAFPGEKVVVIDVGGGSTEVIAGQAGAAPTRARSFDVGCRRLTERYLHQDPPAPDQIAAAANWVKDEMSDYLHDLRRLGFDGCRAIAVAGTATSVISMREKMQVYDSQRVHGARATLANLDALLGDLSHMTLDQRRSVVGLDPGRAPVIVAGLIILRQVIQTAGMLEITVSERDILHGMVLDAARRV